MSCKNVEIKFCVQNIWVSFKTCSSHSMIERVFSSYIVLSSPNHKKMTGLYNAVDIPDIQHLFTGMVLWCVHRHDNYSPLGPTWTLMVAISNILRPRQHVCRFTDNIFKCIFFNENCCILIKMSLKFVPKDSVNKTPALVQIMAWRRTGDKPLSKPMLVCFIDGCIRYSASMS